MAGTILLLLVVTAAARGDSLAPPCALFPTSREGPRLIIDDSVAPDLEALTQQTWEQFLGALQERSDCFGDVCVVAAKDLGSRGVYDPVSATATVRVPGTPAMLRSALVHEWAHHVEFHCGEHKELRTAFLQAQGLPAGTIWRPDGKRTDVQATDWADIPSERYAEATVVFVLGTRHVPTRVRVTDEMLSVIAEWVADGSAVE